MRSLGKPLSAFLTLEIRLESMEDRMNGVKKLLVLVLNSQFIWLEEKKTGKERRAEHNNKTKSTFQI